MASTQGERKFFRQKEKYSLAEKKELCELDKNVTIPNYSDLLAEFILGYFPILRLLRPPFIREE